MKTCNKCNEEFLTNLRRKLQGIFNKPRFKKFYPKFTVSRFRDGIWITPNPKEQSFIVDSIDGENSIEWLEEWIACILDLDFNAKILS